MACSVILSWTVTALIEAFIDLCLAYVLLCGSTIVFFTAKFLGLFGLNLPCSCNGLFGSPNSSCSNICLQRLLVDYPVRRILSVQLSVLSKFPFNSIWVNEDGVNVNFVRGSRIHEGLLEMAPIEQQDEESFSSYSNAKKCWDWTVSELHSKNEQDGFDVKRKGFLNQKPPRYGIRRHRRGVESGKCSSVSSPGRLQLNRNRSDCSIRSKSEDGQEKTDETTVIGGNSFVPHLQYNVEPSPNIGVVEQTMSVIELNGRLSGGRVAEEDVEEPMSCIHRARSIDINDRNTIRILEQALEEEHAARKALYLDLEKERNAAASAADEAMAMILRLQKEKAATEMESRQYQRMIEERSAYDEEEMNLLEEILVKREREKHILEKEVEVYRQMLYLGRIKQS